LTNLILRAGPRAIRHIREHGLRPQDIDIIPGAAGGPKGLGIAGLDLAVFGQWLPRAPRVRHLIGASIGAWRFAAVCRGDPVQGLNDFTRAYSEQRYPKRPSRQFITQYARDMMHGLFAGRELEILSNPDYRLHILVVRGLGLLRRESKATTPTGFAAAALANAFGRRHLRHFLARSIFHDPRDRPAALNGEAFDAFHTQSIPLTEANLGQALRASGSIPLVLEGVTDIEGAIPGTYWDGGIIDYHLHLPYNRNPGLVLYPHFTDKIVPGWLDKALPWRKASGEWLDNVVLVAPSRDYLARLPYGKLPDRKDFKRFELDYDGRMRYWRKAMAESERLGDEFLSLAESGDIAERLEPL
jgi:Patatin-like phospholipase